jgi:hypothetical protein
MVFNGSVVNRLIKSQSMATLAPMSKLGSKF